MEVAVGWMPGLGASELELLRCSAGDFVWRARDFDGERLARLFQIGELAGEDGFAREMAVARENVLTHLLVSAAQIDDAEVESRGERIAIALLQCGAGQHRVLPFCCELQQARMNVGEPWRPVGVSERNAVFH